MNASQERDENLEWEEVYDLDDLQDLKRIINERKDIKKSGCLNLFGDWVVIPPMDVSHTMIKADIIDGALRIHFDGGEKLLIWEPTKVKIDPKCFFIGKALKVRWEWHRSKKGNIPVNLHVKEYSQDAATFSRKTNSKKFTATLVTDSAVDAVALV